SSRRATGNASTLTVISKPFAPEPRDDRSAAGAEPCSTGSRRASIAEAAADGDPAVVIRSDVKDAELPAVSSRRVRPLWSATLPLATLTTPTSKTEPRTVSEASGASSTLGSTTLRSRTPKRGSPGAASPAIVRGAAETVPAAVLTHNPEE